MKLTQDQAHNYLKECMFKNWLGVIHRIAGRTVKRYYPHLTSGTSEFNTQQQQLYMAGLKGLASAIKNWNPSIAASKQNTFKTYAHSNIEGHMRNHLDSASATSVGSRGEGEQGVHPHFHRQARKEAAANREKTNIQMTKPAAQTNIEPESSQDLSSRLSSTLDQSSKPKISEPESSDDLSSRLSNILGQNKN
jgi:DNA-directed RNA polymerase specialized sigma subunit